MSVLVTGANGHIGCNVVRALLEDGQRVVALVRPGSDRRGLAGLDVELREGDVLDAASVNAACSGVEVVMHVAAPHRNFAADENDIIRPAVEGTRNVLDACARAGVKRLVLTSTAATIGFSSDPLVPLDESSALTDARSPYLRAKIQQERLALGDERVEVVVLNPSGVFGPHDYRITPAMRAIVGFLSGDPAFLAVTVTDVRDVGRAHVLAAKLGAARQRYLITGEVLPPARVAETFRAVSGIAPKVMRPPRFLINLIAGGQERKARKSGQDASITRAMVDDVWGKHLSYDSSRSKKELGMSYRPARDVIRDAVVWLRDQNALPPKVAAKLRLAPT